MSHCSWKGTGRAIWEILHLVSESLYRINSTQWCCLVGVSLSFKHMLLDKRLSEHQTNKNCTWLSACYHAPECKISGGNKQSHILRCNHAIMLRSARFRGAIRNIMSYAMDHGKHLTINCSAAGVLVMISKSAKDASNHSSSSAEWFVFIIRKTTSTVVTLQAGPGIFVIGFALYGILFDPLRDSLWSAAFCSRMKKFSFRIMVSRIAHYNWRSCVYGKQKRTYLLFLLTAITVFCSCNSLGQSFVYFIRD